MGTKMKFFIHLNQVTFLNYVETRNLAQPSHNTERPQLSPKLSLPSTKISGTNAKQVAASVKIALKAKIINMYNRTLEEITHSGEATRAMVNWVQCLELSKWIPGWFKMSEWPMELLSGHPHSGGQPSLKARTQPLRPALAVGIKMESQMPQRNLEQSWAHNSSHLPTVNKLSSSEVSKKANLPDDGCFLRKVKACGQLTGG